MEKMKQYLEALKYCYQDGKDVDSRAGKVRKVFGHQIRFDLKKGFPALTTKKLAWKAVVSELCIDSVHNIVHGILRNNFCQANRNSASSLTIHRRQAQQNAG